MAITAEQLSFATVMDVAIVPTDFQTGITYTFTQGVDSTHELPFVLDGTGTDTALKAKLNAVIGIFGDEAITTTATTLIITYDTDETVIFDFTDNTVAFTQEEGDVVELTLAAHTEAEIFNVDGTGLVSYIKPVATLDSLTISNITQEGPRKEGRGGKYNKVQVRWGKAMRLEMEDVIFNLKALGAIGGASYEDNTIKVNDLFPKSYMLVGDTFIINKSTGDTEDVYLVFPDFLADGIFEINMEADGDLAVMGLAGELFPNTNGDFFYITDKT